MILIQSTWSTIDIWVETYLGPYQKSINDDVFENSQKDFVQPLKYLSKKAPP